MSLSNIHHARTPPGQIHFFEVASRVVDLVADAPIPAASMIPLFPDPQSADQPLQMYDDATVYMEDLAYGYLAREANETSVQCFPGRLSYSSLRKHPTARIFSFPTSIFCYFPRSREANA